jgi:predicted amidophosphoribosyltransferase
MDIDIKNPKICANCKDFKSSIKCSKSPLSFCNDFDGKNTDIQYNEIVVIDNEITTNLIEELKEYTDYINNKSIKKRYLKKLDEIRIDIIYMINNMDYPTSMYKMKDMIAFNKRTETLEKKYIKE